MGPQEAVSLISADSSAVAFSSVSSQVIIHFFLVMTTAFLCSRISLNNDYTALLFRYASSGGRSAAIRKSGRRAQPPHRETGAVASNSLSSQVGECFFNV